jgi:hypothetical protein
LWLDDSEDLEFSELRLDSEELTELDEEDDDDEPELCDEAETVLNDDPDDDEADDSDEPEHGPEKTDPSGVAMGI